MLNHGRISPRYTATLLTLLLLLAGSAMAQGQAAAFRQGGRGAGGCGIGGDGDRMEMRLERLTERLELTEDQVQKITAVREANQEKNQALRKSVMQLRLEQQSAWLADDVSEKNLVELTEKIADLKKELAVNRTTARLEMLEQLTPEQQDKMVMMMARKDKNGSGQRGHGRSGCGGRGGNVGCGRGGAASSR